MHVYIAVLLLLFVFKWHPCSTVNCPVCDKQVSAAFMNSHLDSCLTRTPSHKPHPLTDSTITPHPLLSQGGSKTQQSFKKLPKFVCSAMKEKELRKKLKTYGLSGQGKRPVLIKRLDEFILQYNSQCDSTHPKSSESNIRSHSLYIFLVSLISIPTA